jgi:tetraacyldisaccharide 4'-kinase
MFKILLYPFAVLYDLITRVRNYLYNTGRRGSIQFDANVISVGNLTIGGTGKTPHIEYLIRILKNHYKVATLSRGYGRKTKGFRLADENSSASSLGDEPFQYYKKFGKEIAVAVGEERALAIPSILMEKEETQVILLDDAYQHRSVRPLLNILLSDYNKPFYEDFLLPAGRLRESRRGANRADLIVVSKCPNNLSQPQQLEITKAVSKYTKSNTPVFFTGIKYGLPIDFSDKQYTTIGRKIVLVTGLANAKPLVEYVKQNYTLSKHFEYPDHFDYKSTDVMSICSAFNILNKQNDHILMTSEKDMVKLINPMFKDIISRVPFFYLPIEIYFLKDREKFDELIGKKGIIF